MIERVLLAVDCFEHSGNALEFMAAPARQHPAA
ncbi:Uncharacterised protein [Serratia marcescens]|uniref:Uncharacterized protein n=1 Tax=Serratia marcescens TaxID=615 RepID=A0A379Y8D0_SERMA|nr:Uncharacterised protein [Serratia marcescens]